MAIVCPCEAIRSRRRGRPAATITNNLIDSSSIPAATPLLKGASGRLWASNDGHLRLELQSSRGDTQIMVAPGSLTVFDSASNTVYHATLPVRKATAAEPAHQPPTLQTITDAINAVMAKVGVAGPVPTDVGGAPAYTVRFTPKHAAACSETSSWPSPRRTERRCGSPSTPRTTPRRCSSWPPATSPSGRWPRLT